jgi:hypothetical protein
MQAIEITEVGGVITSLEVSACPRGAAGLLCFPAVCPCRAHILGANRRQAGLKQRVLFPVAQSALARSR